MTGHRSCLIYYPLWIIDFAYADRSYKAVVDGISGQIIRGRFPGRSFDRKKIASAIGIIWAGLLPALISYFACLGPSGTGLQGSGNCLLAGIMVTAAIGIGSWKLLDLLDSVQDGEDIHAI
jgi:hypothetical protein